MSSIQNVSFKSIGRYSILGDIDESTKSILFVFHGQGQLARYFIQKFKPLLKFGISIIAPEGLHQYYLEGFSGRVGASWMTSENRLIAIKNYLNYLDSVFEDVSKEVSKNAKFDVLGFSQGAATASRWIEQSSFEFEKFILWGGALPPDLTQEVIAKRMQHKKLIQVIGKNDPYINKENENKLLKLIQKYKLSSKIEYYDGGHDILTSTLIKLFE